MKHVVVAILATAVSSVLGVTACGIAASEERVDWSVAAWWIAGISIVIGIIAMCITWLEENGKRSR